MPPLLKFVCVVLCFQVAEFSDKREDGAGGAGDECVIELECEECLPQHVPAVTSHAARRGVVRVPHGDELALSCGAGHFLGLPRADLVARCDNGRYVIDGQPRVLLELGCQQDMIEDVLHPVEHCAPPLQGRAYEVREGGRTRHLATLCYDADRALAVRVHTSNARALPLAPHSDARAPLSILGNFNEMFDVSSRHEAERLFSDDARLERRLRELFKHEEYSFAEQRPTAGRLLAAAYFDARDARASAFPSNRVVSWRSVVRGNLRHVHEDVAALLARRADAVDVYAGTHGVLTLDAGAPRPEVYMREGRRFPVPRYVWTVVHAPQRNAAVALVVLNDPFVTVSEIRAAVFCTSACGRVSWLARLRRHRNYERPALGLAFCCELPEFAAAVAEMPRLFNDTIQLLT